MKSTKTLISISIPLLIFILSSCKYQPFIKYFFQKKDSNLPSFHKKDYRAGSITEPRSAYDVTKYDWYVKPNSQKQSLEAEMTIEFVAKSKSQMILLDLHRKLKIDHVKSDVPIEKYRHKGDLLYISFAQNLEPETKYGLRIKYHGKPVSIQNEGPIQWKKDKNDKDWISTQTQGIGPHYMMPCKTLLYDEAENCTIRVEADKDLSAVANGKLDSITEKANYRIFHHSVHNPINIYNISFNIGDFVKLEKDYTDIQGHERKIQVYPLKYDSVRADTFYNDAAVYMEHLESLFGPFPWWEDGCKFVQSTLGRSAMEHQSAISMGSIYYHDYRPPGKKHINTTVIHEMAHEWWGNMITANDYAYMWIHEGMASYAELLVIEKIYGKKYYTWSANRLKYYIDNSRPVIKTPNVQYNSWVTSKDQNIYSKGAMCMHSLRAQFGNDTIFLSAIRKATDHFALQNINSDDFEAYLNKELGEEFSWLFDLYLRNTEVPELIYAYDSVNSDLKYRWAGSTIHQEKLKVHAINDKDELVALNPKKEVQNISIRKGENDLFNVGITGYIIFVEVPKEELKL